MRKYQKRYFVAAALSLALLLTFAVGTAVAEEKMENPHLEGSKGYCVVCHPANDERLLHGQVGTCTICHSWNIANHPVVGHPINKVVNISTPSPLPLSRDKKIVCSTCHDPHANTDYQSLLRVELKLICLQCHRDY